MWGIEMTGTKPLTHEAMNVSGLLHRGTNVIGELVYYSGEPQRIGIVREVKVPDPAYIWNAEVLVEWQSGKKVWRRAGSMSTIDSKIEQERINLAAFEKARDNAKKHFGV
jgi:hypothetical protein